MVMNPPASSFQPHLNGLRALAILGVVLYHLRAAYCPAGYFGVDVFLVLSGFLLWRSLLAPGRAATFHYGRFLLRKAWRILPSWFVVTLATTLTAALLFYPQGLADTLKTAAASAVCVADYAIDLSGDYFNPLSQQNPLLHFWYLSLTQQFYLIAPLLVLPLAGSLSIHSARLLLAILGLLSLGFYLLTCTPSALGAALLQGIGARSAYYHLIPRFWELAAGGFVFLLPAFAEQARLRAGLGAAGVLGVLASFYLYSTGSSAVYLAVASTLLAIRYADGGCMARLLNCRPLQGLGRISFSLYLWHWPVMVFWKYCRFDCPGPWDEAGMLAASLLLSTLSWQLIERHPLPATSGWWGRTLRTTPMLGLPLVFGGALALQQRALHFAHEAPLAYPVLIQHPVAEPDTSQLRGLEGLAQLGLVGKPLRLGSAEGEARFLLMGDSHAQHLYDALHEGCLAAGLRGLYLNNTVAPYHGLLQPQVGADTCRWDAAIEEALLAYLRTHPHIRHVLIAQCWQMRMSEGAARESHTGRALAGGAERAAVTAPGLGLFCDRLRALGCTPVLLGETPRFPRPCPMEEWQRRNFLDVPQRERSMSHAEFEERHALPLATLRALAAEGRAQHIELTPALRVGEAYPARHDGAFWYYDANHLTPVAARRVVERCLLPQLQRLCSEALTSPHSAAR